ncbi:MAG: hypothetical protein ABW278_13475 [Steroidobacteraceae bacterium]
MTDWQLTIFVLALCACVIPLSMWLALRLVRKTRQASDQPLASSATGIVVPVRSLKRFYRFFGQAENGISPRLEIVDAGLHFKVFKPVHWLFADIVKVDAPWSPFVTRLVLRHRHEGQLCVDLAGPARASDFLRALPQHLHFTPRAVAMRDSRG